MWCAISRSAAVVALESINGVGRRGRTKVGLKTVAVDDINRAVEQTGYVVFQSSVVKDSDAGHRIKFDHDIDITVGPVVAARMRAEQGRVTDAARARPSHFPAAWQGSPDCSSLL